MNENVETFGGNFQPAESCVQNVRSVRQIGMELDRA